MLGILNEHPGITLIEVLDRVPQLNEEILFTKEYVSDNEIVKDCETLRYVEDVVRNRVAHEMVGISDSFIKSKVGLDSESIMQIIKKLLFAIDGGLKSHWDSYDKMNEFILTRMEEEIPTM